MVPKDCAPVKPIYVKNPITEPVANDGAAVGSPFELPPGYVPRPTPPKAPRPRPRFIYNDAGIGTPIFECGILPSGTESPFDILSFEDAQPIDEHQHGRHHDDAKDDKAVDGRQGCEVTSDGKVMMPEPVRSPATHPIATDTKPAGESNEVGLGKNTVQDDKPPSPKNGELPMALRTGEGVEALVGSRSKIGEDVIRVRHAYQQPACPMNGFNPLKRESATPDEWLSRVLIDGCNESGADPVWRYAVAVQAGLEKARDWLWDSAFDAYCKNPDGYDSALGNLILPLDLRKQARFHLAEQAYKKGSNATAAADWAVYEHGLILRRERTMLGLSTGYASLDKALRGLRGLTFLAGGTGIGKTTLALAVAVAALRRHSDLAVLFFSLDMPKHVLFDRLLCHEAGITYQSLMDDEPTEETTRLLKEARERLQRDVLPRLRIVELHEVETEDGYDEYAFRTTHRRELREATGASRILVVIDYFGLIPIREKKLASMDQDHRRLDLLKKMLAITQTTDMPQGDSFLVISEVRKPTSAPPAMRSGSGRSRLTLDDLLGSSRIGYAPDAVLLVEPEDDEQHGDELPLIVNVAKGRDGTVRGHLKLVFDYKRYNFREPCGPKGKAQRKDSGKRGEEPTTSAAVDPLATGKKRR